MISLSKINLSFVEPWARSHRIRVTNSHDGSVGVDSKLISRLRCLTFPELILFRREDFKKSVCSEKNIFVLNLNNPEALELTNGSLTSEKSYFSESKSLAQKF